mmetsp:Transcript_38197/g.101756  ORF Transcript_38197/g.101756 Transcript_38197/m.101756 type:complete len:271 (+) Transcript_38197:1364-2176(+)
MRSYSWTAIVSVFLTAAKLVCAVSRIVLSVSTMPRLLFLYARDGGCMLRTEFRGGVFLPIIPCTGSSSSSVCTKAVNMCASFASKDEASTITCNACISPSDPCNCKKAPFLISVCKIILARRTESIILTSSASDFLNSAFSVERVVVICFISVSETTVRFEIVDASVDDETSMLCSFSTVASAFSIELFTSFTSCFKFVACSVDCTSNSLCNLPEVRISVLISSLNFLINLRTACTGLSPTAQTICNPNRTNTLTNFISISQISKQLDTS